MTQTASIKECSFKQPERASYNSGDTNNVAKLAQKVQEAEKQKDREKIMSKQKNISFSMR
ncbi:hypothetical protein [Spiroplasma endosymbiont of Nebria brevicollis]|uniref:hypothetical protein n=1 Tax=Spiroplasma endosymbiont of Nebria brevicollis TaxID=3066284 RepID=UPI00313A890E